MLRNVIEGGLAKAKAAAADQFITAKTIANVFFVTELLGVDELPHPTLRDDLRSPDGTAVWRYF
jgi:hypothetical protein